MSSQESSVTNSIELYDHDFFPIEMVVYKLREATGTWRDMEGFRREVIERFAYAGFVVEVKVWSTNVDGAYWFDADIVGRVEKDTHGFDHERQAAEVQANLLGIETEGAFGADGRIITPPKSVSFSKKD